MSNSINTTNNLTSTSIPELYIRYFNPKININTDIIIPYYVSDSTQEEFLRNTNTKSFTTIVKIGNNTFSQTTNAGEYSINIGSISTTGETYFSIYTIDENGVASVEQFFDILIIDSSYTITSSQTYTMVESDLTKHNIVVGESVSNTVAQSNNTGLNNLFNEVKNNGYRKIIMLNRIYMLDYHGDKIMPPSEFTVDMNNATFKATQCTDINVANLVDLRDCFDTHVINGILVGNYDGFDFATTQSTTGYYIPGEGLAVAEMNGARYSSFENMDMSYSVGYNLGVFGGKDAGYVGSPGSLKFSNAYYINGNNTINSDVLSTTDLIDITGLLDRGEIQCSVYLNYGGLKLNRAELFIHFYNSSSNYMTTVKTRQYQMVKIPDGATQVRVTGFTASSTDNSGLSICHTGYSKNCELINIKSHNTRTCAMHPGIYNHLLIKNCTFNRVADENEYKVTKLALDFEDGYENGRNLFFINNEVYEGTSALTIQRCFNANIIGCRNFGLDTRGHIKGAYIKNNFFNNGDIYTTNFDSQSHLKLINNTFFKTLNFLKWDDTGNYDSIGLTELDCKNGYTNNKNCTLFIRNESSGSGDSGDSGGTDTPSSYTITNNLTNCTTNNNNESVSSDSNYTATITANSGYVMASIVVTMGGADISDTAVSGNNINIPSVTGNIVITAVASEQAEVLPNITLFDNGLIEGYTISNGANYEVSNVITLSYGADTYFGFDQTVTFNSGDSINFVINTCGSDSSSFITRVCYLDNSNRLQGYDTAVTDDVISAGLPYVLTHTFNSKVTIKPALMKYFGSITISKVYVIRAGSTDDTTYYSIVNNLTNCTNNNNSATVSNNSSYSATITANDGYTISSITVTMGGEDITSNVVSGNNINISNVTGNIVITANTSATYTITNNLTNCTNNNDNNSISSNSSYSATITANTGYVIASITVTMNEVDITSDVVSENNINISNVTGNIIITAIASEQVEPSPNITLFDNGLVEGYTISNGANYEVGNVITLNHGSNTYFAFDQTVTFNSGDSINFIINTCSHDTADYNTRVCHLTDSNELQGYETVVTDDVTSANLPYKLTHTFSTTTTIKPALMKYFGNITVSKVYVIRAGSTDDTTYYSITNNLTNCTTNNNYTSIASGSSYSTTITPNDEYEISSITVTMGETDITSSAVSGNNINIPDVTGNISITANASAITYSITNDLTNCTTNNNSSSALINSSYSATITANDGYAMSSITVTMGVTDISDTAVSDNVISISSVTGNIVITAVALKQVEIVSETVLFDNGLIEGYTISNGANYTVGDKITLNHGSNTYFGFDQTITFNKGDSINFVINTCGSDASGYITRVCWLDDNNALQGYETAVTDDVVSANLPYTLTHTFNSTTTIKPALMKYFGNITISKVYVTTTEVVIGEQPLYKFGLLSDAHVDGDGTDKAHSISDLKNAIQYFNNENCKFIVHCGDVTENGRSEDYTALKSCLATSSIPNYSVRGNHDMTNGYSEATGCADDYTITQNNDLFIFLSPSATSGTLSDNKLNWLEHLLATNTDKRVFFIYHFFFNNTAGNASNLDNGGLPSSNASVIRLKAMIESYSNLIFCNGHSHLRFNLQDLDPNANYYHEEGKCYYVHVPSTSRPRGDNGSGGTTNIYGGSEGYLVEVYADKVVFKPIDFIASEYLSKYNYTVNVAQDNNVPTEPSEPTEPPESSSEVIATTWSTGNISSNGNNNDGDTSAMRTDSIEFNIDSYEYYITVTNEFEGIDNIKVYFYNSDSTFNSRKALSSASVTPGVPFKIAFPITTGTFRVKADFLTTNTLENINDRLIVTKVAKETPPETPPESSSEVITPTWTNGGISSSSGADISDAEGMRCSYMEFDTNAYTYYITVTNEFEGIHKLRVAIYNPDGSFVVRQSYTSTSLTPGVPGAIEFPVTSGKFRLKVDFMTSNTLENINNRLVITKVAK